MYLKKQDILNIAEQLQIPLVWKGYQEGFGNKAGFDLFNDASGMTIAFEGMTAEEVKHKLINLTKEDL